LHKAYVKHLNFRLYYQQLHLNYLCNLARYWLRAPWGWHDSVETCRSVIICGIIVHWLVKVQNNKNNCHLISGYHSALLQSITFIGRLNALDYTKLRG